MNRGKMKYCIVFMIYFLSKAVFADCSISVGVSDFPPQSYQTAEGEWKGISVELVEVLMSEVGCTPVYQDLPWKRAVLLVETGKLDVLTNVSITDERSHFMHFIGPQQDEIIVIGINDMIDISIEHIEDINKFPGLISIQRGAFYGDTFSSYYKENDRFNNKFIMVNKNEDKIKLVNGGRTQGLLEELYLLCYEIKTNYKFKGMKIHKFKINHDVVYFAFSKKSVSQKLYEKFKSGFVLAKEQGLFSQVFNKYNVVSNKCITQEIENQDG